MEDTSIDWDTTDLDIELLRALHGDFIVWVVPTWEAAHALLATTSDTPAWDEIGFVFGFGEGNLTVTTPDNLPAFERADRLLFDPREGSLRIDPFASLIRRSGETIIVLDEDENAYIYGEFGHGEEFAL